MHEPVFSYKQEGRRTHSIQGRSVKDAYAATFLLIIKIIIDSQYINIPPIYFLCILIDPLIPKQNMFLDFCFSLKLFSKGGGRLGGRVWGS